jgi:hypothetical protein
MSPSWQWVKANPDEAARKIRELGRENIALRTELERANQRLAVESARANYFMAETHRLRSTSDTSDMQPAERPTYEALESRNDSLRKLQKLLSQSDQHPTVTVAEVANYAKQGLAAIGEEAQL